MVQFTTSTEGSAIVATTSKSEIMNFSIPKGRTYHLTSVWFGGADSIGIIEADIWPSLSGRYVFNSSDENVIDDASQGYPISIVLPGPSQCTLYCENVTASSTTVRAMVTYVDTSAGTV